MAEKTARKPTPRIGKARGGRPTNAEALRRRIEAASIDPDLIDPRKIPAGIAIDTTASASARVAACRTLLTLSHPLLPALAAKVEDTVKDDPLTRRALQIQAARFRLLIVSDLVSAWRIVS